MFYGTDYQVWDPVLIVLQIVFLQVSHYLIASIWLKVFCGVLAQPSELSQLLKPERFTLESLQGYCVVLAIIVASPFSGVLLSFVVERAKKCLDFTATLHLIHFVVTLAFGGLPTNLAWWGATIVSAAVCVSVSEFLCVRREMQAIQIGHAGDGLDEAQELCLDKSAKKAKVEMMEVP